MNWQRCDKTDLDVFMHMGGGGGVSVFAVREMNVVLLATDLQPARWIDAFHEPDGTHRSLIVSGENGKHEDKVRRAIREADGTWSTTAVDGSQSE